MTEQKINGLHRTDEMIIDSYQAYELKDNWKWLNFSDVFTNATSSKKKVKQKEYLNDGKYPIIDQGQDAIGGFFDDDKMVFEGDLPIIIFGDHTRCIKYVDYIFIQGADGVKVLAPKIDIVNPRFAYFMMINLELPDKGYSRHFKYLKNSKFPIPPLPEQQRIINRIESLFEKIDEAETLINEAREGFEKRKEAILAKAFRGDLTEKWREENDKHYDAFNEIYALKSERLKKYNSLIESAKKKGIKKPKINYDFSYERNDTLPEGWVEAKLDKLVYFAGRIGWKGLKADEYVAEGPMLLSVYNLNYGDYVDFSEVNRITDERYVESPEIMVQNDDILLTKDGAGIGKLGYVKNLKEKATINGSLLLIRADNSMLPKYLYYFLKGPYMQQVVRERITGSTTPHLFQRDIKNFVISIPPIEEQKEIVKVLDILSEEQEKIDNMTLLSNNIDLLKKSILAKAFRGELGTNNSEEMSLDCRK